MPQFAKKVDLNHAVIRRQLRDYFPWVIDTHSYGGGFPDLIVLTHARHFVMLEIKTSPGDVLTDAEKMFHGIAYEEKAPVLVVYSARDAIQKVALWEENHA